MAMATKRRMGPQDSTTSNALLDAAEHVMREEGYAAATSRRIAEVAGVKQQLVYYYFRTMDDLLLATFKRRTERALERLKEQLASDKPIELIWRDHAMRGDARLSFEFMALSNRHEGVRDEVARYILLARRLEAEAFAREMQRRGADMGPLTPAAVAFLISCVAMFMGKEAAAGVTEGHEDVCALFDWALARLS